MNGPLAMTLGSQVGRRNQPPSAAATGIAAGQRLGRSRIVARPRLTVAATFTVDASPSQGTKAKDPATEPMIDPSVFAV